MTCHKKANCLTYYRRRKLLIGQKLRHVGTIIFRLKQLCQQNGDLNLHVTNTVNIGVKD